MNADALRRGVVKVEALFSSGLDDEAQPLECQVVKEDALTLDVKDVGAYTLMWTPTVPSTTAASGSSAPALIFATWR